MKRKFLLFSFTPFNPFLHKHTLSRSHSLRLPPAICGIKNPPNSTDTENGNTDYFCFFFFFVRRKPHTEHFLFHFIERLSFSIICCCCELSQSFAKNFLYTGRPQFLYLCLGFSFVVFVCFPLIKCPSIHSKASLCYIILRAFINTSSVP